jgi:hypothetical protein
MIHSDVIREARPPVSEALIPYESLLQQFKAEPAGKLYCLYGSNSVFRLSLAAAAHALLRGVPITLVDGTNRFDVYSITEFARRYHSAPGMLLDNIFISRAFTCYQMEATMTKRVLPFVRRVQSPIVIVFGLLDTMYDEQAPLFEVKAGMRRIIASLGELKRENIAVLLASVETTLASRERNALFPGLCSAMDRVFHVVDNDKGIPRITELHQHTRTAASIVTRGGSYGKNGADIYHGHPAGNGKLDKIPPRAAQRRSGCAG